MQPSFARKIGFHVWKSNIGIQKIDGNRLEYFEMVIASFVVDDKDGKSQFFEETCLLADDNMNVIFVMFFPPLNNVKIYFID